MEYVKAHPRRARFDSLGDEFGEIDEGERLAADPGYLEFELDQTVTSLLRFGRPVAEGVINGVLRRHGFEVSHG